MLFLLKMSKTRNDLTKKERKYCRDNLVFEIYEVISIFVVLKKNKLWS